MLDPSKRRSDPEEDGKPEKEENLSNETPGGQGRQSNYPDYRAPPSHIQPAGTRRT